MAPAQRPVIVVGVDGSPESECALARAVDVAESNGSELVAVFARSLPVPAIALSAAGSSQCEAAFDAIEVGIEATLVAVLADRDVRWRFECREGDPEAVLVAVAEDLGADLIVVGHRGRSRVGSLLLGSVASGLLRHAPQSVLVARPAS